MSKQQAKNKTKAMLMRELEDYKRELARINKDVDEMEDNDEKKAEKNDDDSK